MRNDFLGIAKDFDTSRVFLDLVNRSVELGCSAVRGEHVAPKKVPNTTLYLLISLLTVLVSK